MGYKEEYECHVALHGDKHIKSAKEFLKGKTGGDSNEAVLRLAQSRASHAMEIKYRSEHGE